MRNNKVREYSKIASRNKLTNDKIIIQITKQRSVSRNRENSKKRKGIMKMQLR